MVVGDDGVLVVDTQQSPAAARALVAKIRELTAAPVRFVVNTHWHGDHVYGNAAYRDAFPGAVFVAHGTARDDLLARGPAAIEEALETLPESIRDRERWLETGVGPDGEKLDATARARLEYSRDARRFYLGELRELELVPPSVTLEERLRLYVGGRPVDVTHLGPAHTRGDVVVYLPDDGILAAGDLVEDAFPYFGDAFPSGWAAVLGKLQGLGAGVVLPSHGPVLRDGELLDTEARLMRELVARVRAAAAVGKSLEATQDSVTLPSFASFFTEGDPDRLPGYRASVRDAVERAYREIRGDVAP